MFQIICQRTPCPPVSSRNPGEIPNSLSRAWAAALVLDGRMMVRMISQFTCALAAPKVNPTTMARRKSLTLTNENNFTVTRSHLSRPKITICYRTRLSRDPTISHFLKLHRSAPAKCSVNQILRPASTCEMEGGSAFPTMGKTVVFVVDRYSNALLENLAPQTLGET